MAELLLAHKLLLKNAIRQPERCLPKFNLPHQKCWMKLSSNYTIGKFVDRTLSGRQVINFTRKNDLRAADLTKPDRVALSLIWINSYNLSHPVYFLAARSPRRDLFMHWKPIQRSKPPMSSSNPQTRPDTNVPNGHCVYLLPQTDKLAVLPMRLCLIQQH